MGNANTADHADMAKYPEVVDMESNNKSKGKFSVEIAASVLFGIPPLANAYHTSIVVKGEEYFFSDQGMCFDDKLISHQGKPTERYEAGRTDHTGTELWWALQEHFRPGTYDLLRKNCNSFSDAALFFLLRKRLDKRYSSLETLGRESPELVRKIIYIPNPVADEFNLENVIEAVTKLGEGKKASERLAEVRFSIPSQDHRIPHLPRPSIRRKKETADKPLVLGDITNNHLEAGPGARASEAEANTAKARTEAAAATVARPQEEDEKTTRAAPRKYSGYAASQARRPPTPPRQPGSADDDRYQPQPTSLTLPTERIPDRSSQTPRRMSVPRSNGLLTNRVYPTNRKSPGEDKENLTPRGVTSNVDTRGASKDSSLSRRDSVTSNSSVDTKGDESRRSRSKGPTSRFGFSMRGSTRVNGTSSLGGA